MRSRLLVKGLVGAASGGVCWSCDWWAHQAEPSSGLGSEGRSKRSRLLVLRLVGAASGCRLLVWRLVDAARKCRLLVWRLAGAESGAVCWSGDWWVYRLKPSTSLGTGGRSERSRLLVCRLVSASIGCRLLVWRLVGAASGVVCWAGDWRAQRAEAFAGLGSGGRSERSRLLV